MAFEVQFVLLLHVIFAVKVGFNGLTNMLFGSLSLL